MARGPGKAISSDESVAHVIALDILRHAFVDLAASFGRNDAAAAGAAVESIEPVSATAFSAATASRRADSEAACGPMPVSSTRF